jgi:hypothetical protein
LAEKVTRLAHTLPNSCQTQSIHVDSRRSAERASSEHISRFIFTVLAQARAPQRVSPTPYRELDPPPFRRGPIQVGASRPAGHHARITESVVVSACAKPVKQSRRWPFSLRSDSRRLRRHLSRSPALRTRALSKATMSQVSSPHSVPAQPNVDNALPGNPRRAFLYFRSGCCITNRRLRGRRRSRHPRAPPPGLGGQRTHPILACRASSLG